MLLWPTRFHEPLEGLNSSLSQSALRVMAAKIFPDRANYTFCETFLFLSKAGFSSHNFGSRYASKSIKGSQNAHYRLVSKKNWAKKWLIRLAPRARHNWPKTRKHAPSMTTARKPQTQNEIFFLIWARRRAESAEGLNSSLAQSAGEL